MHLFSYSSIQKPSSKPQNPPFHISHCFLSLPGAGGHRADPRSQVGIISGKAWPYTFHRFSTTGAEEQEGAAQIILSSRPSKSQWSGGCTEASPLEYRYNSSFKMACFLQDKGRGWLITPTTAQTMPGNSVYDATCHSSCRPG